MKRFLKAITLVSLFLFSSLAWSVDINTADAATLAAELNGVGEKRAEAIVEYRDANGPFKSVDDLLSVKGIGPALLEKNREKLSISEKAG